jgi:hypothetical protein
MEDFRINLRVQRKDKKLWDEAARAAGKTFSEWLRNTLNLAVHGPKPRDIAELKPVPGCRFGGCRRLAKAPCAACLAAENS